MSSISSLAVHMPQGYHPHLSTRPDYKRSGSPINITNYVKTSAAQANDVVIYWGHDILYPMVCVCVYGSLVPRPPRTAFVADKSCAWRSGNELYVYGLHVWLMGMHACGVSPHVI